MIKRAVVYEWKGAFYISTSSRTTAGVWIGEGIRMKINTDSNSIDIGKAVRTALDSSRYDIPHPSSWDKVLEPLLTAAGVKSWAAFGRKAKCLDIELDKQMIIQPTKNFGSRRGFVIIEEKIITIPADSEPDYIGESIKQAILSAE